MVSMQDMAFFESQKKGTGATDTQTSPTLQANYEKSIIHSRQNSRTLFNVEPPKNIESQESRVTARLL